MSKLAGSWTEPQAARMWIKELENGPEEGEEEIAIVSGDNGGQESGKLLLNWGIYRERPVWRR